MTDSASPSVLPRGVCALQAVASNKPDAVLHALLAPCTPGHFADTVRERGAMLVRRPHSPAYNAGVLSADDIWALLKAQPLRYGSNVDVARYTAEWRRETFNHNAASAPPDVRPPPFMPAPAYATERHRAMHAM